jgi:hypothetical protein
MSLAAPFPKLIGGRSGIRGYISSLPVDVCHLYDKRVVLQSKPIQIIQVAIRLERVCQLQTSTNKILRDNAIHWYK